MESAARAFAALAAVALAVAALAGVSLILLGGLIAAQAPDPFVADGDPCCGHPDTWGDVAGSWTLARGPGGERAAWPGQRSVNASRPASATNAAPNTRRIHVSTAGRESTWLRTAAAKTP